MKLNCGKKSKNYIAQVNILNVKFQFSFKRPIRWKLNEKKKTFWLEQIQIFTRLFLSIFEKTLHFMLHIYSMICCLIPFIFIWFAHKNAYRRTGYEKFNTFTNGNEMESSILIFTFHQQKSYQNVRKSALNEKNQLWLMFWWKINK